MNIALWIVAGVLAVTFAGAGTMKALTPKPALKDKGMAWVEHFSDGQVKAIGALELLGAVGLILPAAVNVLPILVAVAATGLAITMVGAAVTHIKLDDVKGIAPSIVLLALAVFVAVGRFGVQPF